MTVCFDTCHVHDAGYDIVDDLDGVLEQFDRIIGLERIAVVHLNDSKNFRGAKKDRHAPLGSGMIGFEAIKRVVYHEKLQHLPMILETPWIGKQKSTQRPMYKVEIALLRGNVAEQFDETFLEDVEKIAHYMKKQEVAPRNFILDTWDGLKKDAKARKADPREPMERLYDMLEQADLFEGLTEEDINHRLTAWLSGDVVDD